MTSKLTAEQRRELKQKCAAHGCRARVEPGEIYCHQDKPFPMPPKDSVQRVSFNWGCLMCGRASELKMTEDEAAGMRPDRCATCGGRMLLSRSDIGHLGGSFDPSVPASVLSRQNHYRSKLGSV